MLRDMFRRRTECCIRLIQDVAKACKENSKTVGGSEVVCGDPKTPFFFLLEANNLWCVVSSPEWETENPLFEQLETPEDKSASLFKAFHLCPKQHRFKGILTLFDLNNSRLFLLSIHFVIALKETQLYWHNMWSYSSQRDFSFYFRPSLMHMNEYNRFLSDSSNLNQLLTEGS